MGNGVWYYKWAAKKAADLEKSIQYQERKGNAWKRSLGQEISLSLIHIFLQRAEQELTHTQPDVRAMMRLVRAFHERYARNKEETNVLDYADMEHFALRALSDGEMCIRDRCRAVC